MLREVNFGIVCFNISQTCLPWSDLRILQWYHTRGTPPQAPLNAQKHTWYHSMGTSWWRTCEVTLRLCRGTRQGHTLPHTQNAKNAPKHILKTYLLPGPKARLCQGTFEKPRAMLSGACVLVLSGGCAFSPNKRRCQWSSSLVLRNVGERSAREWENVWEVDGSCSQAWAASRCFQVVAQPEREREGPPESARGRNWKRAEYYRFREHGSTTHNTQRGIKTEGFQNRKFWELSNLAILGTSNFGTSLGGSLAPEGCQNGWFSRWQVLGIFKASKYTSNFWSRLSFRTVQKPNSATFSGPYRVPGRELSELLSAYYLCANSNSPSLFGHSSF